MTLAYVGAAAGAVLLAGQQSGSGEDLLRAVLQGEAIPFEQVIGQAQRVMSSGMTLGQAALIIAFVPVVMRLLQMLTPYTDALAEYWRRHLMREHHFKDGHRPQPSPQPPPHAPAGKVPPVFTSRQQPTRPPRGEDHQPPGE